MIRTLDLHPKPGDHVYTVLATAQVTSFSFLLKNEDANLLKRGRITDACFSERKGTIQKRRRIQRRKKNRKRK